MSDPLGLISNANRLAGSAPLGSSPSQAAAAGGGPSFKETLMKHIDEVNQLQKSAQTAIEDLASGRRDDVAGVMLAKQKADLAFQTLLQVRNKMVAAYEEIKQIRV